eukprot:2097229-Rhodomonas_salina.1
MVSPLCPYAYLLTSMLLPRYAPIHISYTAMLLRVSTPPCPHDSISGRSPNSLPAMLLPGRHVVSRARSAQSHVT